MAIILVYIILFLPTEPSVSRKKVKKVAKKVLTDEDLRGIIYKSTRYGNKTKAKIARHWQREIAQIRENSSETSEIILQYIERVERRVCEEDDDLSKPEMNLEN